MSSLPVGDHTPKGYTIPQENPNEGIKKVLRRILYPPLNFFNHHRILNKFNFTGFKPNLYLWGQRGNDYERHRRRVAKYIPIHDKKIMVAGCGTGRDIESWAVLNPKSIVGVDLFNYENAWSLWLARFKELAPKVDVSFKQSNLNKMEMFPDASFDIVSSDAVFEHVVNLPEVLKEFHRILRPGGILYATFGPLWYGWGGDHVSGYENVLSGYNHLLLKDNDYKKYLDGLGEHNHNEHDGRTWIEHGLFSKLTVKEYIKYLDEAGFKAIFISAIIDPNAVKCMELNLFETTSLKEQELLDLLTSGMTIIYERK